MQCDPTELYGLARRRNKKRAMLVVSNVLAKHVPVPAPVALAAGRLLAEEVSRNLRRQSALLDAHTVASSWCGITGAQHASTLATQVQACDEVVVVGFCETAVALGAIVATTLRASYVHSTRYPRSNQQVLCAFSETHSHAPDHVIAHDDINALTGAGPLILVDDELTTGRTAVAAIEQIHRRAPRRTYIIAALLDWRTSNDDIEAAAERLSVTIDVVSLHRGDVTTLQVPDPCPLVVSPSPRVGAQSVGNGRVIIHCFEDVGPATPFAAFTTRVEADAARVAGTLEGVGVDAVIGVEECMFLPILVAARLGTTVQSTTLSPVVVSSEDGYPIRSVVEFTSPFGKGDAYVYNVAVGQTVAVITDGGDLGRNTAMAEAIAAHTGGSVHLVLTGDAVVNN